MGITFVREDWTLFRNINTLGQKAGVERNLLPRLMVKELVDNALDASGVCRFGLLDGNGFYVEDDGPGLPGDDGQIATMFSINRPLNSSKLLRLPTRGAMGNGLRVVAGAVISTMGVLSVATRDRRLTLRPIDEDGTTAVEAVSPWNGRGTRVEVVLGRELPVDRASLDWGHEAVRLAGGGKRYDGKTSALWYDDDSFWELLRAAGPQTVRDVIQSFDGLSGRKGDELARSFGRGREAGTVERREAVSLLTSMRADLAPFNPARLKGIGPGIPGLPADHAKESGTFMRRSGRGGRGAEIPYIVEVWAEVADRAEVRVAVNRTPITAVIEAHHEKTKLNIWNCGLSHHVEVGRKPIRAWINVETP